MRWCIASSAVIILLFLHSLLCTNLLSSLNVSMFEIKEEIEIKKWVKMEDTVHPALCEGLKVSFNYVNSLYIS